MKLDSAPPQAGFTGTRPSGCRRIRARRAALAGLALGVLAVSGCAGRSVHEKLGSVGLQLLDETTAQIPADERGLYLPCRVVPGAVSALEPDDAGYLIVGVDGHLAAAAEEIVAALEKWKEDVPLRLWVRRNPHRAQASEWWEGDVLLPARTARSTAHGR